MAFSRGVKSEQNETDGVHITEIHNGDYIKVREVDFSRQPREFKASLSSGMRGGTMEVRLDSISGEKIAEVKIGNTGGWYSWKTCKAEIKQGVSGTRDLFFVFTGEKGVKLMNFNWWEMK